MPSRLTLHDASVLEKIKDPESAATSIMVDPSLPPDPNLDHETYAAALEAETKIINDILVLEKTRVAHEKKFPRLAAPLCPSQEERTFRSTMLAEWSVIIRRLDELVGQFPRFASARNNRATALRGMYGDGMLVKLWVEQESTHAVGGKGIDAHCISDGLPSFNLPNRLSSKDDVSLREVTRKVLHDLTTGIALLTPTTAFGAISPKQAERLGNLHMQRGRLYRVAADKLSRNGNLVDSVETTEGITVRNVELKAEFRASAGQEEARWSSLDFEENASRDFMIAGRYGNETGKALAVAMNPTAKLCGEIVREAMRKEYALGGVENQKDESVRKEQPTRMKTRSKTENCEFDIAA
ncbi:hypothetical protein D0Z07_5927 [Hyphodiscus hymeniophilus]|uniref:Uncharacterized protein n=1 Tax=Hyphodiscus hymeniophilus TaxID=353542 RepID=A0A9P6VHA9_9HELO|nr:hypothetical protein D0Z07_5927 [Hyphodiscus hymeniophilus]